MNAILNQEDLCLCESNGELVKRRVDAAENVVALEK